MTLVINQQTGYVDANKASFYYEMAGTGEPLVLIHAGITDRRLWDNQFYEFARHYQAIRTFEELRRDWQAAQIQEAVQSGRITLDSNETPGNGLVRWYLSLQQPQIRGHVGLKNHIGLAGFALPNVNFTLINLHL